MLIRRAELWGTGSGQSDVRIHGGTIAEIGNLAPRPDEAVIEAQGGALLPGLHDHHIHLAGLAARAASVDCSPSAIRNEADLARVLAAPGTGWLRGTGLCESVLGQSVPGGALPDRAMLDAMAPHRPLRIQHRTGRMWFLNSAALAILLAAAPAPGGLEHGPGGYTGRLFDEDGWLQAALGAAPPDLSDVSAQLASYGVTGVTDMSPCNADTMARHFESQRASGRLHQSLVLAGTLDLHDLPCERWQLGPAKLHLHEADLPDFDETAGWIEAAHRQGRGVAVHCVTEVELIFTLALFEAAGTLRGDRIEHASVVTPEQATRMAELDLWACVQPHFVAERGDRYLADVEARHHPDLYRLRTLADAGVPLAGGSDAPYGSGDPWAAMRAAVSRTTPLGLPFTPEEALSPEAALALFLCDPLDLPRQRRIAPGEPADLCLLSLSWQEARERLCGEDVRVTMVSGDIIHERVDQPPVERLARGKSAA